MEIDILKPTIKMMEGTKLEDWKLIEEATGLSHQWLRQFCAGKISNPGVLTIQKLHNYLVSNR